MKHFGIKLSLFLVYFVFAALLNSVGILVERSQEVYDVTKEAASFLEPFKDISIAIVAFLVGSFLPRLGYKKAMLLSLAIIFMGCLGMYYANSFWAVKILFACTGLSFAVAKVSVYALIGYVTDSKDGHSSLLSFVETVFMMGIIFMYLVFPLFYGDENDKDAWLRGYLLMAGVIAVAFIIISLSKFDIETENKETSIAQDFRSMINLFVKPVVWVFALFAFFYVMTEQGIMTWLPTFNKETLRLDPKLAAQIAVLLMVFITVGRFLTGIFVKKINWLFLAIGGVVFAGIIVLVVLPLAQDSGTETITKLSNIPLAGFLFPLIGLFLAPLYPLVSSRVLSSVPKESHSALAGILTFSSAVGGTFGSIIVGFLFDTMGGSRVFYLSLIPLTILLVIFISLNKLTKQTV